MQRTWPTAVWLGRLAPDAAAEQERFLAELRRPETRRRFRENYHLTGYRLEAAGDRLRIGTQGGGGLGDPLRVTFSGATPAALANFLKAHRYWPSFWRYEGRGAVEPPGAGGWTVLFDLGAARD